MTHVMLAADVLYNLLEARFAVKVIAQFTVLPVRVATAKVAFGGSFEVLKFTKKKVTSQGFSASFQRSAGHYFDEVIDQIGAEFTFFDFGFHSVRIEDQKRASKKYNKQNGLDTVGKMAHFSLRF